MTMSLWASVSAGGHDEREPTKTGPAMWASLRDATAAPSIHNTQPWLFLTGGPTVDVFVDNRRRLTYLDPDGREMRMSVGAALFNLRIAILARGRTPHLRLRPDEGRAREMDEAAHRRASRG